MFVKQILIQCVRYSSGLLAEHLRKKMPTSKTRCPKQKNNIFGFFRTLLKTINELTSIRETKEGKRR